MDRFLISLLLFTGLLTPGCTLLVDPTAGASCTNNDHCVEGHTCVDSRCEPIPEPVCEPGRSLPCGCPDGTQATQSCSPDGLAWGECLCGGEGEGEGEGGSGGDVEPEPEQWRGRLCAMSPGQRGGMGLLPLLGGRR